MTDDRSEMPDRWQVGTSFEAGLEKLSVSWQRDRRVERLWEKDSSLWTGADEGHWLGWLDIVSEADELRGVEEFGSRVRESGITDVLLLGMGGASLGAEVLCSVLAPSDGAPALRVLDTTDPAQILRTVTSLAWSRTLVIVSSKSGTTLESTLLSEYVLDQLRAAQGPAAAAAHVVAITDRRSPLDRQAVGEPFRQVWYGGEAIGGRFSVLSRFGLGPAGVCKVNVTELVSRARRMAVSCGPDVPVAENPGVRLGLALGLAASTGRDKLTVVISPAIGALGVWLEQLLAESLGKSGRGIVPIVDEVLGPPEAYGQDRLFVYLRLASAPDVEQDVALARLAEHGHPVIELSVSDPLGIGAELFRWECATAVCASVLQVNPFDQPDVESSKVAARAVTQSYVSTGIVPQETPLAETEGLALYATGCYADHLRAAAGAGASVSQFISAHLEGFTPGDYCALLAYLDRSATHRKALHRMRHMVRDTYRVATSVGFGPRFLHSTGQAFKGGTDRGIFLQITSQDLVDVAIPGRDYTFGVIKAAQARGDLQALVDRGRRVLWVHLEPDAKVGLRRLEAEIGAACS